MPKIKLNYRKYGSSGQSFIILHGLFGSLVNWHTICEALEPYFEVYALDLRNHGDSPHSERFQYESMVHDLKRFVRQHQISDSILLGHSMGGKAAMAFAAHCPEYMAKLIVVDIAPKTYPPDMMHIIEAMLSLNLNRFSTLKEVVEELEADIPDLPTRYFLVKNLVRGPDGSFKWKLNLKGIYGNFNKLFKWQLNDIEFRKPSLFIRGSLSNCIEEGDLSLINSMFPQAKFVTISGAGHWVHIDMPEKFIKAILSFAWK